MSMEQMIGFVVVLLIMFVGIAGCVIPGLPGAPVVLAAAVGHRLYFGVFSTSNWVLGLLIFLALLSIALDYLGSMVGAKGLGATWKGVLGAIVGAVVGIFFSLPGIILGPFLGAMLFEMIGGREMEAAAKAGLGAMLGLLLGAVGKLACTTTMVALFAVNVISRSGVEAPVPEVVLAGFGCV